MVPCVIGYECEARVGDFHPAVGIGINGLTIYFDGFHTKRNLMLTVDGAVNHVELWIGGHEETEDAVGGVVGSFGTIDQRTAFYSHSATVVGHLWIGNYGTYRHIEMERNNIAFLPNAVNDEISFVGLHPVDRLSVDGNLIVACLTIGITVEVAGYWCVDSPTWNTDSHGKCFGLILLNAKVDVAIPWIVGLLFQYDGFTFYFYMRRIAGEEIDIECAVFDSIDITWE